MKDPIKFQRQEQECTRCTYIESVLKSASNRYLKIRADQEVLTGEYALIVKHIKSYPDYEYFLDAFLEDYSKRHNKKYEPRELYSKFNMVRIVGDVVELKYEPLHYRFDGNNYTFGVCKFEDILNIENIIEEQKQKYLNYGK